MKNNLLSIFLIFVMGGVISLSSTLDIDSPTINIETINKTGAKKGEIILFTVKVHSSLELRDISITPNIKGQNDDDNLKYEFDSNVKKATISYFYVVPENIGVHNQIQFDFKLQDASGMKMVSRFIKIYR